MSLVDASRVKFTPGIAHVGCHIARQLSPWQLAVTHWGHARGISDQPMILRDRPIRSTPEPLPRRRDACRVTFARARRTKRRNASLEMSHDTAGRPRSLRASWETRREARARAPVCSPKRQMTLQAATWTAPRCSVLFFSSFPRLVCHSSSSRLQQVADCNLQFAACDGKREEVDVANALNVHEARSKRKMRFRRTRSTGWKSN